LAVRKACFGRWAISGPQIDRLPVGAVKRGLKQIPATGTERALDEVRVVDLLDDPMKSSFREKLDQ